MMATRHEMYERWRNPEGRIWQCFEGWSTQVLWLFFQVYWQVRVALVNVNVIKVWCASIKSFEASTMAFWNSFPIMWDNDGHRLSCRIWIKRLHYRRCACCVHYYTTADHLHKQHLAAPRCVWSSARDRLCTLHLISTTSRTDAVQCLCR